MKKKIIPLILSLVVIVFCTFLIPVLVFRGMPEKTTLKCKGTYTVENGTIKGDVSHLEFDIHEDGEYYIEYSWMPEGTDPDDMLSMDPSSVKAVTAIRIADQAGKNAFGTSAGALKSSTTNYLTKGRYSATFTQFANRDEYVEYAKEYLCANADAEMWADGFDFDAYAKDGECTMEYCISYNPVKSSGVINLVYFLIVVVFTIAVAILIAAMMSGKDASIRYDERQIQEQGKAFKLGFFTTIITLGLFITADLFGIVSMIEPYALYGSAIFIGLMAYVVYCVWHEAYFALNQRTVPVMIMLGAIALMNIFISVTNIVTGRIIENGRVTLRILNVLCAVVFLVLFATLLLKKISNAKNDADEDDDSEEISE